MPKPRLGAKPLPSDRARFSVWAPKATTVHIRILGRNDGEPDRTVELLPSTTEEGYYSLELDDVPLGTRYLYSVDCGPWRPDPASRSLPDGVHGASELVSLEYAWIDKSWRGVQQEDLVFYEMHVGTFTREGTFDAAINGLDALVDMGVTAVELMPVAEVPGGENARNWGYDGVQLYCVRRSYGGVSGLQGFVDACHTRGLAVFVDVVYNHLGPEGNYLDLFGYYHSDLYSTPWGRALNFDGPHSDDVRHYFMSQAVELFEDYRVDGLRLDSTPNIFDRSPKPFLEELAERTQRVSRWLNRPLYLVAEADDNSAHWVRPPSEGGLNLDAMWVDDPHHAIHAWFTGERSGYYEDFGRVLDVAKALTLGGVLDGRVSGFRRMRWGRALDALTPSKMVIFLQNHDRIGNRADGQRTSSLVDARAYRTAVALTLLAPQLPLLFMGQEYGEDRPFYFFTSFDDSRVVRGLRSGRASVFGPYGGAQGQPPDPQLASTRQSSVLEHGRSNPHAQRLRQLHKSALTARRNARNQGFLCLSEVSEDPAFFIARWSGGLRLCAVLSSVAIEVPFPLGFQVRFDSETSNPDVQIAFAPRQSETLLVEGPRVIVYGPPVGEAHE